MSRATLNGIEIDYTVSGRGRPVILSHGYGATGRMWDGQRRALGDRYRLITWDMRGHGQTASPSDPAQFSTELTVADIQALLGSLGATRAVVGGLSLGGYMSLAFYLAHPEMVDALIICDSGPGYRNAEARNAWNQRATERAGNLESRGLEALGGRSREVRDALGHHKSAQGLAHAARGMLGAAGFPRDRRPRVDPRAHTRDRRRPGHALPRAVRVHGEEDPGRSPRGHRRGGARLQPRSAGVLRPRAAPLPRLAAGLSPEAAGRRRRLSRAAARARARR